MMLKITLALLIVAVIILAIAVCYLASYLGHFMHCMLHYESIQHEHDWLIRASDHVPNQEVRQWAE